MNKHMIELNKLALDDLIKMERTLREEISTMQKSIRLGNTQNYRAATTKRRHLARVSMLIKQGGNQTTTTMKKSGGK